MATRRSGGFPLCQDQIHSNKVFALVAGSDYIVYNRQLDNQFPAIEDTVAISLVVQNRGLTNSDGPVLLTINPLNDASLVNSQIVTIPQLPARMTDTTTILLSVPTNSINGTKAGLHYTSRRAVLYVLGSVFFILELQI
ncbi:MAG: hypothetical protein CM1200mP10_09210 [Candidatus Neomarinimicrobiota bacterium]|nr:MAG: hypothetical protein CM1200mP10_09210 [Candidatus Neomarinimicrobiota bacterium]